MIDLTATFRHELLFILPFVFLHMILIQIVPFNTQNVLDLLHRISQYISGNMETVRDVWTAMKSNQNNVLEPTELAAFLRRLVKGIGHREQHFLLMHLAGKYLLQIFVCAYLTCLFPLKLDL